MPTRGPLRDDRGGPFAFSSALCVCSERRNKENPAALNFIVPPCRRGVNPAIGPPRRLARVPYQSEVVTTDLHSAIEAHIALSWFGSSKESHALPGRSIFTITERIW